MTWSWLGLATRPACERVLLEEKLSGEIVILDMAGLLHDICRRAARQLFDPAARLPGLVHAVTTQLRRLVDANVRVVAVLEGPGRPVEKSQCNAERRAEAAAAREEITKALAAGDEVDESMYVKALKVPQWLGQGVVTWIQAQRSYGVQIGCVVAPLEADAQCAALMKLDIFRGAYWMGNDNDTPAWGTEDNKFLRPAPTQCPKHASNLLISGIFSTGQR